MPPLYAAAAVCHLINMLWHTAMLASIAAIQLGNSSWPQSGCKCVSLDGPWQATCFMRSQVLGGYNTSTHADVPSEGSSIRCTPSVGTTRVMQQCRVGKQRYVFISSAHKIWSYSKQWILLFGGTAQLLPRKVLLHKRPWQARMAAMSQVREVHRSHSQSCKAVGWQAVASAMRLRLGETAEGVCGEAKGFKAAAGEGSTTRRAMGGPGPIHRPQRRHCYSHGLTPVSLVAHHMAAAA